MSNAPPPDPENPGGFGGQSELPPSIAPQSYRDTRLIERAIRERWPIKDEWRAGLVARQAAIAGDKKSSPREATAAFRALLEADKINVGMEEREMEKPGVQVNVAIQNTIQADVVARIQEYSHVFDQLALDAGQAPIPGIADGNGAHESLDTNSPAS